MLYTHEKEQLFPLLVIGPIIFYVAMLLYKRKKEKHLIDSQTVERIVLEYLHNNGVAPAQERLQELIDLYKKDEGLYKAAVQNGGETTIVREQISFVQIPFGRN